MVKKSRKSSDATHQSNTLPSGGESSSAGRVSDTSSATASILLPNGFLAVSVAVQSSSGKSADVRHWIYVRQQRETAGATARHADTDSPPERTLFIANLPADTTESHLREIFHNAGPLSAVTFRSGTSAGPEEEDESEQKAQGEDEIDGNDVGGQRPPASKAGAKGKALSGAKVPRVTPLPSLDPRVALGSQGFLQTCSSAHLVFLDAGSLQRALDLVRGGLRWVDPFRALRKEAQRKAEEVAHADGTAPPGKKARTTTAAAFLLHSGAGIPPAGPNYLLEQYTLCRPALDDVRAWADSTIQLYQYRKAHPLPRKVGVRGVTVGPSGELLDEDGFIIVQRSGKYGRAGASAEAGGSVAIAKRNFQPNTQNKSEGLEDFYRFQLREKKREQLAELRAKFEADKQKVARLKAGRRFRPY